MTTTSYRVHAAVGVRQLFLSRPYSTVRSRLCARGTMTTTSYRVRVAAVVRHLFSVEALLCRPVTSCCTRNDDNDILPQPLGSGCSSHFFCRGTTLLCTRNWSRHAMVGVRHFSVGPTLLSGRVLVHAER
ncbi:uncharacterized protein TNCV_405951 [Trichonephila clavipes]|nr:uncharacterized protein TNCV_405951 [Trichonephila clavipes]